MLEELALRAYGDEFAGGHRERAGGQSRDAGQQHDGGIGARTGDAEDQTRVRHEPVVDAENRRAQVAATAQAPVPMLDVAGNRRAMSAGLAPAVDRHSADLHRRQHGAQPPRTEELHQPGDEPRAQIRHERWRRGFAARGQLGAPDRGLRLTPLRDLFQSVHQPRDFWWSFQWPQVISLLKQCRGGVAMRGRDRQQCHDVSLAHSLPPSQ